MALPLYLAMTAAEFQYAPALPTHPAWMACHFSPYGTGLSNLPAALPAGSLLILNDRTPIHGHDPRRVAFQLESCVKKQNARGILLDLQRPGCQENAALAAFLVDKLPCPVGVSEPYARELDCPVFLPPVPPDMPLEMYLSPYKSREIWLEAALTAETILITEQGATVQDGITSPEFVHSDDGLHCHYGIVPGEKIVSIPLWRTSQDLDELLAQAEELGVRCAVGLYQELNGQ